MKKDELFYEIEKRLLNDEKPSDFLKSLQDDPVFYERPFSMLSNLIKTEQSPQHHPEGSVWNHTLLVVDNAAKRREKSKDKRVFMWAALLHDIGKAPTTSLRKGKITSYDHDKVGQELAREFLSMFTKDQALIEKVCLLVRWHMQILFVVKNLPFAEVRKMVEEADIEEVALLGLCDRLGRGGNVSEAHEQENIRLFLEKVRKIEAVTS